jgi:dipeptidyl aminopeptidase/acylaminoacyl peptidase
VQAVIQRSSRLWSAIYSGPGAVYYGISDLETLASSTHKFGSRYFDRPIGVAPALLRHKNYRERSPIHLVNQLSSPVILFHGLEDRIVPIEQSKEISNVARARGIPSALIEFKDEDHGFQRSESIKRALEAELYFYSRVLDLYLSTPAEPVEL